jgi:DNA (cytosine-5)-methyltransferase 1
MKEGKKQLTFIDLFAGAGGLSEGFIRSGYKPVAYVEKDINACLTLKSRLAYHFLKSRNEFQTYVAYLKGLITRSELYELIPDEIINSVINETISNETLPDIFTRIDNLLDKESIDLIIGGPPCQAYSVSGRSARGEKAREDDRNYLYKYYGEFLKKYKPKIFVFENVPGLYTAGDGKYYNDMISFFDEIGYETEDKILDASDFGVLQRRKRVIIIGWQKELNFSYPVFEKTSNDWTIANLFSDLPALKAGQSLLTASYVTEINECLLQTAIRNGLDFVTQHVTRPHNKKDLKIYKLAIKTLEQKGKCLKNDEIPENIRTQKNVVSFLDRFKVVRSDSVSHTMIAHIAKDGHHFIHPDINQLRSISVREAARIQSFPDDYFFEGSRTNAFTQIGNAVPLLMAQVLAKKLLDIL